MGQRKVWAFSNVNIYCHYLCQLQSFGWNSLIGLSSPSDTVCIFVCGPAVYCCLPFVFRFSGYFLATAGVNFETNWTVVTCVWQSQ